VLGDTLAKQVITTIIPLPAGSKGEFTVSKGEVPAHTNTVSLSGTSGVEIASALNWYVPCLTLSSKAVPVSQMRWLYAHTYRGVEWMASRLLMSRSPTNISC
jgi:hypothetical protein